MPCEKCNLEHIGPCLPKTQPEFMQLWRTLPVKEAADLMERWLAAHPEQRGGDKPRYKGVVLD